MALQFLDPADNPIALGTMVIEINADAKHSSGQVGSRIVTILLDTAGKPNTTAIKALTDLSNNFGASNAPKYTVTVYAANGERVWGPAAISLLPAPFAS